MGMALARTIWLVLLGGPALSAAGCNSMPELPTMQIPSEATQLPITTTEAYTRIAQGAVACWFGPRGRLTRTHIFHADAAPPSRGGTVEIIVHERAIDQPKPWGYNAFRVSLKQGGDLTQIGIENLRMPDDVAQQMRSEVLAWVRGSRRCMGNATPSAEGAPLSTSVTYPEPKPSAARPASRN